MTKSAVRPFIKWAGGKTQLLGALYDVFPTNIKTYYDVFLGGGSVFFGMGCESRFDRAVINDWNPDLVNTYKVVRDFPDDLIKSLCDIMAEEWNTAEYFAGMRSKVPETMEPVARAARMIYLNKTCFNGLYRQNNSGQFNVPFGKFKNPALFDEPNLRACSQLLNKAAAIHTGDFTLAVDDAGPGDVVYLDPPYVPMSSTSNFSKYTADGFDIDDQHRLAALVKVLADRGVTIVISNSDTPTTRSLYEGMQILPVQAKRHINSKGDQRGPVGEIIAVHYGAGHGPPKPIYEIMAEMEAAADAEVSTPSV